MYDFFYLYKTKNIQNIKIFHGNNMNRDWKDFKSLHENIAGAREAFENACEILFRKMYSGKHVSQVAVKQGDGGIDIFIGELGIEPIIVIQCKFFLESFEESQKQQIRESFETAVTSKKYELGKWILCIPRVIDIDETSWWFKWKHKNISKHSQSNQFIELMNGNNLIDLMKEHDIYHRIFKIEDSIKIDEIHRHFIKIQKETSTNEHINVNTILFNNYTKKSEPFYCERDQDDSYNASLKLGNIWVFGRSGVGKTTLINRNLIQNKIEYLFCDLSPITIDSVEKVLEEIICSIEEKFELRKCSKETNLIKQIVKLLNDLVNDNIVIVIDELAVDDIELLRSIASSFISLVTHYSNVTTQKDLKFVISTIAEPKQIIQNRSKASEHFQYMCCDNWEYKITELFDILNSTLDLKINDTNKTYILQQSKNSPRILKNIFRKLLVTSNYSEEKIQQMVKLTLQESY